MVEVNHLVAQQLQRDAAGVADTDSGLSHSRRPVRGSNPIERLAGHHTRVCSGRQDHAML
jgi:hypothetical protein